MNSSITRKLFSARPEIVAPRLLGMKLSTCKSGRVTSGIIVEVEAYCGERDPACHCYSNGRTKRTEIMFHKGGLCYVYFIYGMYHCVNVVAGPEGVGAAVLIRAIEPLEGIELMKRRRKTRVIKNLTSGPGKLCQALGIDKSFYGEDMLSSSKIWLEKHTRVPRDRIVSSGRIGINSARELKWRFFIKESPWVSKAPKSSLQW
ncbi:MAG: DNA-3-methyladenine glycosylase [Candidatus Dadabacteria bacterium]|nr:MAG: DNA-3-methyladenine glycosylase [Candidatus Dadabacteria bacterium]